MANHELSKDNVKNIIKFPAVRVNKEEPKEYICV